MGDGEGAWDEAFVPGVELLVYPVWPDPVEVVLDDTAVDEATGVEDDACAEEFDGFVNFGRLGETPDVGE